MKTHSISTDRLFHIFSDIAHDEMLTKGVHDARCCWTLMQRARALWREQVIETQGRCRTEHEQAQYGPLYGEERSRREWACAHHGDCERGRSVVGERQQDPVSQKHLVKVLAWAWARAWAWGNAQSFGARNVRLQAEADEIVARELRRPAYTRDQQQPGSEAQPAPSWPPYLFLSRCRLRDSSLPQRLLDQQQI